MVCACVDAGAGGGHSFTLFAQLHSCLPPRGCRCHPVWVRPQFLIASCLACPPALQPTPDDMDLAVEYDLDEEDEEWLEQYNEEMGGRVGRQTPAAVVK